MPLKTQFLILFFGSSGGYLCTSKSCDCSNTSLGAEKIVNVPGNIPLWKMRNPAYLSISLLLPLLPFCYVIKFGSCFAYVCSSKYCAHTFRHPSTSDGTPRHSLGEKIRLRLLTLHSTQVRRAFTTQRLGASALLRWVITYLERSFPDFSWR